MATWPTELPQRPQREGYSRTAVDNVIRSTMSYGPPKQRKRVTTYLYNVTMRLYLFRDQYEILNQFYEDNASVNFDWVDFAPETEPAAKYIFLAPPAMTPLTGIYFAVNLSLQMESYG